MANSNFFTRAFDSLFNRKQLDTSYANLQGNYHYMIDTASQPEHEIQTLFNKCKVNSGQPRPRDWVKLSRMLYDHFSLYERAIDVHVRMVGGVIIAEDSEISDATRQAAEKFFREVRVLSEMQPFASDVSGINSFVSQIVVDILKDGMAFAQDRFREIGDEVTDEYLGAMVFDPVNFDYMHYSNDTQLSLSYLGNQFPRLDEDGAYFDNPYFHVCKLETDHADPWGVPLIRGGKLLADILITMLVAIKAQTNRFGNPVSFNIIQQNDPEMINQNTEGGKIFIAAIKDLRSKTEKALSEMNQGKGSEIVTSMPGSVKIDSKTFGSDFTNFIDHETLWKISLLFANVLSVPPTLLGIRIGGGGIGSEEFKYMYSMLLSRVGSIREVLKPFLIRIVKNHLVSLGARDTEGLRLDFSNLDTLTPKEKSEIDKMDSETESNRVEVYNQIQAIEPDSAQEYAENHGLFG